MKKLILLALVSASCVAFTTSCSKDVKAPSAKVTPASSAKTSPASSAAVSQTHGNQNEHTCGAASGSSGY